MTKYIKIIYQDQNPHLNKVHHDAFFEALWS